jgi:hypothetical protein
MKNFELLASNIDTQALVDALAQRPHLWNQRTLRTKHSGSHHSQVDDIWLRFNPIEGRTENEIRHGLDCIDYPPYEELAPWARDLVVLTTGIAAKPKVGRCLITRLKPNCEIHTHIDGDRHSQYYTRIHLVLTGGDGNMFYCGNESVNMRTGELWWFNNRLLHSCKNTGTEDRIHIVMDVKND